MHEQSIGVGEPGKYVNAYGPATGRGGQPLPLVYGFERPSYPTIPQADLAAIMRSLLAPVAGTRVSTSDYLRTNPDPQAQRALLEQALRILRGLR
jgi:hypothetical protein